MADGAKFVIIRKLLKALGLSDEAINDVVEWIEDLLTGKTGKQELTDLPYKLRDDFLSPAELNFYLVLKGCVSEWADVCPKVNLGDLFFASCKNFGQRQSYTNKINRKHVDFLLCDPKTAKPMVGIELDDKSHNQQKRQERDLFVEQVFGKANLPLERFSVQHSYNTSELNSKLQKASGLNEDVIKAPPDNKIAESEQSNPVCPKCSGEMVLRTAQSGKNKGKQFWGCLNFPKCRAILPYENTKSETSGTDIMDTSPAKGP